MIIIWNTCGNHVTVSNNLKVIFHMIFRCLSHLCKWGSRVRNLLPKVGESVEEWCPQFRTHLQETLYSWLAIWPVCREQTYSTSSFYNMKLASKGLGQGQGVMSTAVRTFARPLNSPHVRDHHLGQSGREDTSHRPPPPPPYSQHPFPFKNTKKNTWKCYLLPFMKRGMRSLCNLLPRAWVIICMYRAVGPNHGFATSLE